jgi:hypothetical protein
MALKFNLKKQYSPKVPQFREEGTMGENMTIGRERNMGKSTE